MYKRGDRVRLVHTSDEHTSLEPGDTGTVTGTGKTYSTLQVWIEWDNGSRLAMLPFEGDRIEKISSAPEEFEDPFTAAIRAGLISMTVR